MSDVPKARRLIENLVRDNYNTLGPSISGRLLYAVRLMYREKACRRAPEKKQVIDAAMRAKVRRLANSNLDMTITQIARAVGLRNPGRVSEILHNKR